MAAVGSWGFGVAWMSAASLGLVVLVAGFGCGDDGGVRDSAPPGGNVPSGLQGAPAAGTASASSGQGQLPAGSQRGGSSGGGMQGAAGAVAGSSGASGSGARPNAGAGGLSNQAPDAGDTGEPRSMGTEVDASTAADSGVADAAIPDADNGTTPTMSQPSPGCGSGGRPAGGEVRVAGDHIYQFPEGYDGSTPLPAVFAFHAYSNPIDQILTLTQGSDLANNYVMVFPKSAGSGWSLDVDRARFDGWMQDLLTNYCVDENRIFATGHSSGAQFIIQLLCQGESRFRAVAPVAASMYCPRWDPIAALVIHGGGDMERAQIGDADGRIDLAPHLTSNSCQMSSQPVSAMACNSSQGPVDAGCVRFDGCVEPVTWCQHNDPSYGVTNHGWPCFATQAMFDFFEMLGP